MANTRGSGNASGQPFPELRMALSEAERLIDEQLERGRSIRDGAIKSAKELSEARAASSTWQEYVGDLLRKMLTTDEVSRRFTSATSAFVSLGYDSFPDQLQDFRNDMVVYVQRLESIRERLHLYEPDAGQQPSGGGTRRESPTHPLLKKVGVPGTGSPRTGGSAVFVVHGRDMARVDAVVRLLQDLQLTPVVLRDQPNKGRTIIEKVEAHADVVYAVVLLTSDDVGCLASDAPEGLGPRARQNVILELGFFIGQLGRAKVCALEQPGLERPSDIDGILYIRLDKEGIWRLALAKEMKAAGLPVDLNRL